MNPDQGLPFFVSLFRDECYYSILSRYHEISAHFSNTWTAKELFNRSLYLDSTVILPIQILRADKWFPKESSLSAVKLMREHTAWPYLNMSDRYGSQPFRQIISVESARGRRKQKQMQRDIRFPGLHLRYCPMCALEDIRQVQVPYWHIAPQLKGVLLCPVHKIPVLTSDVPATSRTRKFITAASVLSVATLSAQVKTIAMPNVTSQTIQWLICLSQSIQWMLHHGGDIYPSYVAQAYDETLLKNGMSWRDFAYELQNKTSILGLVLDENDELGDFLTLVSNSEKRLLSPLHHAILITELFETPDKLNCFAT